MKRSSIKQFMDDGNRPGYTAEGMSRQIWKRFKRNRLATFGLFILIVIFVLALFAPSLVTHDPAQQNLMNRFSAPSSAHWLGTDEYGRDVFSRLLYGARVSLAVAFTAVLGSLTIGAIIGATAGYYGGWIDNLLMRIVDIFNAFPSIFLLITIVALLEPSLTNIIFVFILLGWTGTARLVRGEFLSLKEREFIWAAKSIGVSDARIMFMHILPNAAGPMIVSATLGVGGVILAESGLSFLGLGIQPPLASWGNMLQSAQSLSVMVLAPWYPLFPGMLILVTVLCFNFIGDGMRDAFDPKDYRQ
ncbi:peptide ABC transporter permease [Ammoniphilus oxalaticus]|uniref:Peptide ABC transporter permease n=1 Tax=Ammoniphilus oxalaticus TaxID=66863 RepID=A0A419SRB8_9BACL|nr:oligopeptide ABC transporter permease [Ammoniphilus oxalaticus]RKD27017.1 peptide ABC transporter permease [Ammoniphilus oxalaticus]